VGCVSWVEEVYVSMMSCGGLNDGRELGVGVVRGTERSWLDVWEFCVYVVIVGNFEARNGREE
jgi:hypothetical protein